MVHNRDLTVQQRYTFSIKKVTYVSWAFFFKEWISGLLISNLEIADRSFHKYNQYEQTIFRRLIAKLGRGRVDQLVVLNNHLMF